jgi:hypothetical protein
MSEIGWEADVEYREGLMHTRWMIRSFVLMCLFCAACGSAEQRTKDCDLPQISGTAGEQLLVTATYSEDRLRVQFFLDRCTSALTNVYLKPHAFEVIESDLREIKPRDFDGVKVGILDGTFDRLSSGSDNVFLINDVHRVFPWVD